jgi:hypothetical protein
LSHSKISSYIWKEVWGKSQIPRSKPQGNPKSSNPKEEEARLGLEFGAWSFFGIWSLELGVF